MGVVYNEDLGKLILRITIGGLMIFHGIHKVTHGISFIENVVTNSGLPAFFAYGVYVGEVLAPLLLILGLYVRFASSMIIATMLMAIYLVHTNDILTLTQHGAWGIELQMFFLLSATALLFLGGGKYSLKR
jgi:putative oxidoreductase